MELRILSEKFARSSQPEHLALKVVFSGDTLDTKKKV